MMERKVLCPTLHVMLVKTIKAFCEVNLQFNHKVEITGSLHVRSDGEKVFTCLLDEEIVRGQTDATASRVAELATRISLANAALTLQHVQGVNHSQQVAEALLFSMQGAVDLNSYFVNPSQSALMVGSDDVRTVKDDCLSSNAALRVSPISPAQDRSAVDLSLEDIRQKTIKVSDQMPIIASMPHFTESHQRPSNRRVETVAKTLAAIKASNASRIEANNAGANQGFSQNHVKLPDIKTLAMAHRLPSYQNARPDEAVMSNAAEVASITGASPILSSLPLAGQNSVTDVGGLDTGAKPDVGRGAAAPSGQRKKFQCMFCGIFLSTKCYLKNHVNAMHTRSRVYQCELCEHFFYSAGAMRIHKLRNHWQGSKKHRCEHCGENFLLPIELRKHIKKKHFAAGSLVETEPAKLEPGEVPASRSQYLCPLYSMPAMTLSQAVLLPSTSMVPMTTEMLLGSDSVTE